MAADNGLVDVAFTGGRTPFDEDDLNSATDYFEGDRTSIDPMLKFNLSSGKFTGYLVFNSFKSTALLILISSPMAPYKIWTFLTRQTRHI